MAHLWTILEPERRVKGQNLVAISLFQADDYTANTIDGVEDLITNLTDESY